MSHLPSLFLLISLIDLNESAVPADILANLKKKRYLHHPPDQADFDRALAALLAKNHLSQSDRGLVEIEYSAYGHIQDLCANLSLGQLSADGWRRSREVDSYAQEIYADQETWTEEVEQEKIADRERTARENLQEEEQARMHGYPYDILLQARENKRGRYQIYVVLLDDAVRSRRGVKIGAKPSQLSVYVGLTGLSPHRRFQNHKANKKAGRGYVRDHGICLLPDLYRAYNPMPYKLAVEAEKALAAKLRLAGYTVLGGH